MPRKQHTYHFIYKTTCIITQKFYVGMHSTSNLEDGYIGSGKILGYSVKKYGRENHTREILEFFPNRETLRVRESEIVNEKFLKDPLCINLMIGGGNTRFGTSVNEETRKQISKTLSGKSYEDLYGRKAEEQREKRRKGVARAWKEMGAVDREKISQKISTTIKQYFKDHPPVLKNHVCPHCGKEGKGNAMSRWHFR